MPPSHQVHQFLVAREFGGAGDIALRFAQHCKEGLQHDVTVWVPGEGRAAEHVRRTGLPIEMYDLAAAYSPFRLRSALANLRIARRLRRSKHGIVHVHDPLVFGAINQGIRLTKLRQIVHVQIEHAEEGLRWAMRRPPTAIVTCARFLVEQVRQTLPDAWREKQRIVAIPNSIDTATFVPGNKSEYKAKLGAPLDKPLVVMLANLAPHKGQETAIRAVAALRQRSVPVMCWLAGVDRSESRQYETHLRQLVEDLQLTDSVSFIGFRTDTADILKAADAMLLPSTNEGLPLAILEAQAAEVPVIAAPTAGVPEVICCGDTGFLVAARDANGYADKLQLLFTNPSLARSISIQAAINCRREYSWTAFRHKLSELYSEVLAS